MEKKLKEIWDNIRPAFAHVKEEDHITEESLFNGYRDNVIPHFDFKDTIVIDYGIGGGYLGKLLFKENGIKKYIGIDVSTRSLKIASDNLKEYNTEFYDDTYDFSSSNADIFISLACIQHFPDKEYLIKFLNNLNNSNISEIMLQIRYNDTTKFIDKWNTEGDIRLSCQTNDKFISEHLNKYDNIYISDIKPESNYQFLKYKKIK
jgi:hypothetical protein